MWLVYKRAAYAQAKFGVPLDEFRKAFPIVHKRVLESKLLSVGYSDGQSVVVGSRNCRLLAKKWLFEGKDGSGELLPLLWRSRLRPLFGVGTHNP